ncbi:hypothetical protein BT63DRAFT_429751 [Microthyrium microscopicum]|uniref:HNH domain-containing protein n=1 Tax=Microthyrium microscopicum TaxID=703497 RepID=A0A6A6TZE1_9PEZI|nr:hypothetical protein BT63DRAFT_429751 [Microthyrium microscopicum]
MSNNQDNLAVFRDCISEVIVSWTQRDDEKKKKTKRKKRSSKLNPTPVTSQVSSDNSTEDLADFIEYIAIETFSSLPANLRTLTYSTTLTNPTLTTPYLSTHLTADSPTIDALTNTLPAYLTDTLTTYALPTANDLLVSVIPAYIRAVAAPPPTWANTRASACELCDRDWVPLTYHHLIPRSVHGIAKRWHEEWELNKVAWLCWACHGCVHRVASNEELAREWHTVERLKEREDIRRFVGWVGGVRWKKK